MTPEGETFFFLFFADSTWPLTAPRIDIAQGSVKHAMERYNEQVHVGKMHFSLNLIAADCCTVRHLRPMKYQRLQNLTNI
jgi:hypothetical protein